MCPWGVSWCPWAECGVVPSQLLPLLHFAFSVIFPILVSRSVSLLSVSPLEVRAHRALRGQGETKDMLQVAFKISSLGRQGTKQPQSYRSWVLGACCPEERVRSRQARRKLIVSWELQEKQLPMHPFTVAVWWQGKRSKVPKTDTACHVDKVLLCLPTQILVRVLLQKVCLFGDMSIIVKM